MLDIQKIRRDFPALRQKVYGRQLVYLDNAATTQKPQYLLDKITEFYSSSYANINRGDHFLAGKAEHEYENARESVRRFIHADSPNEIVFTSGATESINIVAESFGKAVFEPGDELIITKIEHHSNLLPWYELRKRLGIVIKYIPFDQSKGLLIDQLPSMITARTKLISLCHISNALGYVNPVKEVIRIAHAKGIPVLVDAAQSAAHLPVDVNNLDCDFLVFSGHKIYAETGIGVLYAKEKYLNIMNPLRTGGGMVSHVDKDNCRFKPPPQKFEAGTPNIGGAVSMAAAIEYLNGFGMDNIASSENMIHNKAITTLSKIEGLKIYAASLGLCGIIPLEIEGVHPYDAAAILDKMGIAVRSGTLCASPLMEQLGVRGILRASIAIYTTEEDIDMLAEGIKKVKHMLI